MYLKSTQSKGSKAITISISALLIFVSTSHAEIILDGSLGGSSSEVVPTSGNYEIGSGLGQLSGSNLFHSFNAFNIATGQTVTFSGPDSVSNIISRVTGGSASSIYGTITSTIPGADFWLINPSGIVFGSGATLNVQGSFHASTADYVKLRDGVEYRTDSIDNPILTNAAPQSFGFIEASNAESGLLKVEGTQLTVPENEMLSLTGNKIVLSGSVLSAPAGHVSVVSFSEAGEVFYSDQGYEAFAFDANNNPVVPTGFSGSLSISSTALEVDGSRKGNLQIEGGDIEINTHNTDFVTTVSNLKASFFEDVNLLDKPCELAEFYGKGSLSFTVNNEDEETRYGVEVKKKRSGALGSIPEPNCL